MQAVTDSNHQWAHSSFFIFEAKHNKVISSANTYHLQNYHPSPYERKIKEMKGAFTFTFIPISFIAVNLLNESECLVTSPLHCRTLRSRSKRQLKYKSYLPIQMSLREKEEVSEKSDAEIVVNGSSGHMKKNNVKLNGVEKKQEDLIDDESNFGVEESELEQFSGDKSSDESVVDEVSRELSRIINDGIDEIWTRNRNMTIAIEEQVDMLSQETSLSANEIVDTFTEAIARLQDDQRKQLIDIQNKAEKKVVEFVEELAFSDTPLLMTKKLPDSEEASADDENTVPPHLKLGSRMDLSRSMKTREMMRYWKVAPLYYTLALLVRWVNKAPGPRTVWLSASNRFSRLFGNSNGEAKSRANTADEAYKEYISNANVMQSGWKRTGEIAQKGPFRRQLEILRRSMEIWGYFTSFYLKEKRMLKKFKNGKWTEEQFSRGRSELGAEITQNLLKLGPTFIKVSFQCICH